MGANTVWVALATPNAPVGGVPFIDANNEPDIDVLNYFYDSVQKMLEVKNGISFDYTVAAAPGNQVINTPAGFVTFLAGTQTLTVDNSLVQPSSIVVPVIVGDDLTAKSVVLSSLTNGRFILKLNLSCTANLGVFFIVFPIGLPIAQ